MADARELHFHNCIISFVTDGIRLCKWNWTSTWYTFHHEYHCENYDSLTPFEVKTVFQSVVLPKIFKYDLTHHQVQRINTLNTYHACSPKLQRTEDGFEIVPVDIEDIIEDKLKEGVDYTTSNAAEVQERNIATTILKPDEFNITKFSANGNMPIRKCLSFLLQSEEERMQEVLLSWNEIKNRWTSGHSLADIDEIMKEVSFFEKIHDDINWCYAKK